MANFRNVYNSLLLVIAGSTSKELARQIAYLKVENRILRSKLPARIKMTDKEKSRLCRFASKLGRALNELASIVHPDTIRRWIREAKGKRKSKGKVGRRRTHADIEKLVLMLASENGWGYTRILGELRKLGIQSITRNTVKAILKRGGYDTGPNRGPGTWDEFLTRHAKTLWQCDFLHTRVLTAKGLKDIFVLIFLHVETRQVFISPSTYHPDEAWVIGQADKFQSHIRAKGMEAKILMHDRDTKFSKGFMKAIKSNGIKSHKSGFRAPNQNAFVERFIQTLQQECLDHFFVFGEAHMNHLCQEFAEHYHGERPHQGLENESPDQSLIKMLAEEKGKRKSKQTKKQKKNLKSSVKTTSNAPTSSPTIRLSDIRCKQRLGGLLKSYNHKAA